MITRFILQPAYGKSEVGIKNKNPSDPAGRAVTEWHLMAPLCRHVVIIIRRLLDDDRSDPAILLQLNRTVTVNALPVISTGGAVQNPLIRACTRAR